MKWGKTTLLFLLFTFSCFSQEICNNAIDDDGDGMIDLNDTDCACNTPLPTANVNVTSYIPNASFEDYLYCPTQASQLNYSTGWAQCTNTTSDYYNTCGYIAGAITDAGLLPFPDGQGAAGAIFSNDWREYLGSELTTTMQAGKSYQLTFYISSIPVNGDGDICNIGMIDYDSLDITIYGSANAASMPVSTSNAPTDASSEWVVIGSASYQPISTWGQLTITFKPTIDINGIMLGAPQELPASYHNNTCYPYFLFDKLMLTEAVSNPLTIAASGDFCSGDLVLNAEIGVTVGSAANYQWYKNGVAVSGATASTFQVPASGIALGNYAVRITAGSFCATSNPYTVSTTMAPPVVASLLPDCTTSSTIITLADSADLYSFDNGTTWVDTNVSQPLAAGTYHVKAKSSSGCESQAVAVSISPAGVNPPQVSDVELCQYSVASPLIASGTNLQWYSSATGGTGTTVAPTPTTLTPGVQTYWATQSVNGCESARVAVTVTIIEAPEAPETDTYIVYDQFDNTQPLSADGEEVQWYDADGNRLTDAPVPQTAAAGTTTYYATQIINGCEGQKTEIIVEITQKQLTIKYPKFFSPNGDGIHEQWNVRSGDLTGDVYIYDRTGRMLQQMKTTDRGWDGTYNGRSLPATDYWFKVVYTEYGEQKEFSSHFSLVR